MTAAAWRESVVAYIRAEAQPVDKFGHQPRLYALAVRLGHGMDYDDDVLFAAAWMHDLGVFLGHRPCDPEELGIQIQPRLPQSALDVSLLLQNGREMNGLFCSFIGGGQDVLSQTPAADQAASARSRLRSEKRGAGTDSKPNCKSMLNRSLG